MEENVARSMPSIRSLAAAAASIGIVVMAWVSLTLIFDLIFHFHPIFLGVAAGWTLRRFDGPARGVGPVVVLALLSAIGAIAGTAIIEATDGPLDPHGFTAAITGLGIGAGVYIVRRTAGRATADTT